MVDTTDATIPPFEDMIQDHTIDIIDAAVQLFGDIQGH